MSWFNWLRGVKPAPIDNDNPSTTEDGEATATHTPEVPSVMGDATEQPAEDEIEVTAAEVLNAFRSNQVAAEDRFQSRTFVVVGEVRSVQRDYHGQVQVNLAVDTFNALAVLYPDEARELVSKLEPGVEVRVRVCVKESCTRGDVKLEAVETA